MMSQCKSQAKSSFYDLYNIKLAQRFTFRVWGLRGRRWSVVRVVLGLSLGHLEFIA
jgi:hypothetical protein